MSCLLLNPPEEVQSALREGASVMICELIILSFELVKLKTKTLRQAIGEGFTNADLQKELKKGLKPATTATVSKKSLSLYRGNVQSAMKK